MVILPYYIKCHHKIGAENEVVITTELIGQN